MLWVASKALNISPFSSSFSSLSEAQIMWVITNYYKDQEEDLEKFKLICRFIDPQAATEIWDKKTEIEEVVNDNETAVLEEILKHSKSNISPDELRQRILDPGQYESPNDNLSTIEVV